MTAKIIFTEDAKKDIHLAKCYLDTIDKGELFLDDLERQLEYIAFMPYAFQIRYRQVRIVVLETFSYSIHYVVQSENLIIILNVLNQTKDF